MDFALSTAWNAGRFESGIPLAQEISSLGFKNLELNFSLTRSMVEEIFQFCRQNHLTITSLHNYCPIPEGLTRDVALPDCFSLSSTDEDERHKAVESTRITIETAKKVNARAVVLHTGRVEMKDSTRELIALFNKGQSQDSVFNDLKESFIQERKKKAADFLAQILKSLDELNDDAVKAGVRLGVENRFYYREIPTKDEFAIIFNKFKRSSIGYWHDVGHAFIHEQLGFMQEEELLKENGRFLLGAHLHNIKNLDDHQAPINGDFDFLKLKSFIKPDTIKVIEAHSKATPDEIRASVKFLQEVFHG